MTRIIVATTNPAKLEATRRAFARMFPEETFELSGQETASGVDPQPHSDAETLRGAFNRASAAARQSPGADFWVGIEGGIEEMNGGMAAFAWAVVLAPGLSGKGRSAAFFLPEVVADMVRSGLELGQADDLLFQRTHSNRAGGAVGLLTHDALTRADLIEQGVLLALLPFKNRQLYAES